MASNSSTANPLQAILHEVNEAITQTFKAIREAIEQVLGAIGRGIQIAVQAIAGAMFEVLGFLWKITQAVAGFIWRVLAAVGNFAIDVIRATGLFLFDIFWNKLIVGFGKNILWDKFIVPMSFTGVNLIGLFLKSCWYGPWGTTQLIKDGILGAPNNDIRSKYLLGGWVPYQEIERVLGAVTGLGLGLRNYIELLVLAIKNIWYGSFANLFADESIFGQALFAPKTLAGKILAPLTCTLLLAGIGAGVGFALAGTIPAITAGVAATVISLVGVRNSIDTFFFTLKHCIKGLWYGCTGENYFSEGILGAPSDARLKGWRRIFGLAGAGIGLRNLIDATALALKGLWYGSFGQIPEQHSFFGKANFPPQSTVSKLFGIFGLGVGVRNTIDAGLLSLKHLFQGLWYGSVGENYYTDGIMGAPGSSKLTGWKRIFGIFGLGIGLRNVLDSTFMAAQGAWYGSFNHIPDQEGLFGAPQNPPQSIAAKIFGIFGLGIGLRNLIDASFFTIKHALKGFWYGAVGENYYQDGLMQAPSQYKLNGWRRIFGVFGLGIGLRNVIDSVYMALQGMWYGSFKHVPANEGILGTPIIPPQTPVGKLFGIFGLGIGLRNLIDATYFTIKHAIKGFWYGCVGENYYQDGIMQTPGESRLKGWRRVFGVFGLGIGLRNVIDSIYMALQGMWYGSFKHIPAEEGLLGTPVIPPQTPVGKLFGIFGLGIGLRNLIDASYFTIKHALKGFWYGCVGKNYYQDGIMQTPSESRLKGWRRVFGVFGLGVGLRNVIDSIFMAVKGFWYGSINHFDPTTSIFGLAINPPQTTIGKLFGIFGLGIGMRNLIDATYYSIKNAVKGFWYGTVGDNYYQDGIMQAPRANQLTGWKRLFGIFGLGIGLRNVIDSIFMACKGFWYGSFKHIPEAEGLLGKPSNPPQTIVGKLFGVFGLGIGLRNFIDASYFTIKHGLKGFWYGCVGDNYYQDGLVQAPNEYKLNGWRRVFGIFGLGIGLRNVIDSIFMACKGLWYGSFKHIPEAEGLLGKPSNPPQTVVGKLFGVFGLGIGLRNFIDASYFTIKHGLKGLWYGCVGDNYYQDGLVQAPNEYKLNGWRRVFGVFGLGIGLRNVIDSIFMACKGIWYGSFKHIPEAEGILGKPSNPPQTIVGKLFGVFGLGIGLRNFIDASYFTIKHGLKGLWYGCVGDNYYQDGLVQAPNQYKLNGWRRVFGIFGLGIGLRNVIDSIFMACKGFWYGSFKHIPEAEGILGKPSSPPQTIVGKLFGIFGIGVGLRNVIDATYFTIKHAFKGLWYGCVGDNYYQDGLVQAPNQYKLNGWRRIFGIFGLGIGLRNVIDSIFMACKGFWYGSFKHIPEAEGLLGKPSNPPQTIIGKLFGIFGLGVGLRNVIDATYFTIKHALKGIWYGALGDHYFLDGGLGAPSSSKLNSWRRTFGIFGLGIGIRSIIDLATVSLRSMWLGCYGQLFPEKDGQQPWQGMQSFIGKLMGPLTLSVTSALAGAAAGFGLGCIAGLTTGGPIGAAVGAGVLGIAGAICGNIGIKNLFYKDFYTQVVAPTLRQKIYKPIIKPIVAVGLLVAGGSLYTPLFLSTLALRKVYRWAKNIVIRPIAEIFSKQKQFNPWRPLKSIAKLACVAGLGVGAGFGIAALTGGMVIPAVCAGIGTLALGSIVTHYITRIIKHYRGPARFSKNALRDLNTQASQGKVEINHQQITEINNEFAAKIKAFKKGGGPNDEFSKLRPFVRDTGWSSKDERLLKRMHDLFKRGKFSFARYTTAADKAAKWNGDTGKADSAATFIKDKSSTKSYQLNNFIVEFNAANDGIVIHQNIPRSLTVESTQHVETPDDATRALFYPSDAAAI